MTTDLDATGTMLTSISLPRLETVGGHLSAHPAMPPLTAWHTPRLESVGKFAQFVSRDVDLTCLASVAVSTLLSGTRNDPLALPALTTTPTLQLVTETPTARLPALHGGLLEVSSAQLVTLDAASPETLQIQSAPTLTTITLADASFVDIANVGLSTLDSLATRRTSRSSRSPARRPCTTSPAPRGRRSPASA